MVLLACGLLAFVQVLTLVGLVLVARWYVRRQFRQVADRINTELADLVAGKPTTSAAILNAIGSHIGRQAGVSAKAALLADLSHAQRAMNADAEGAAADEIASKLPGGMGGALLNLGPKSRRHLLQNPLLQLAFSAFLNPKGSQAAQTAGDNNQHSTITERLKRLGG